MFDLLPEPEQDEILRVSQDFKADPRDPKIDLGVGVFKDDDGVTAILPSVKEAKWRLHQDQLSKSYLGLAGDAAFSRHLAQIVLGDGFPEERTALLQTPGGSSALRVLSDLLKSAKPDAMIWVPDPTWGNHGPIFKASGLKVATYPYFDQQTKLVDFAAMMQCLETLGPDDIVLFHGCCHNPTGANLSNAQWDQLADLARGRGFFPFIDLAYQGFGQGLDADAYGVRALQGRVEEMVVASSCSKNFAIYRDRVGLAIALTKTSKSCLITQGNLANLARITYSMPPDHGAAIVRTILADDQLQAQWRQEVNDMRMRIQRLRQALVSGFRQELSSDHFDFLGQHQGMFSLLGLRADQVQSLINDHAIYMVASSRINIAGLRDHNLQYFIQSVSKVLKAS